MGDGNGDGDGWQRWQLQWPMVMETTMANGKGKWQWRWLTAMQQRWQRQWLTETATAMANSNGDGNGQHVGNGNRVGNSNGVGDGNCNGDGHGKGNHYKGRVASSCDSNVHPHGHKGECTHQRCIMGVTLLRVFAPLQGGGFLTAHHGLFFVNYIYCSVYWTTLSSPPALFRRSRTLSAHWCSTSSTPPRTLLAYWQSTPARIAFFVKVSSGRACNNYNLTFLCCCEMTNLSQPSLFPKLLLCHWQTTPLSLKTPCCDSWDVQGQSLSHGFKAFSCTTLLPGLGARICLATF